MRNLEQEARCTGRTQSAGYKIPYISISSAPGAQSKIRGRGRSPLKKSDLPQTAEFLEILEGGMAFSFLDIMRVFQEMSLCLTDSDQAGAAGETLEEIMSGKKCRVCC